MKKVIRLTESDLTRIVKRVIEEQSSSKDFEYEKKESGIHGIGLFATEDINKSQKGLMIQITDKGYLYTKLGKYLNHSKDPNVKLVVDNNQIFAITLRNIKKGEEIVCDYDDNPNGFQNSNELMEAEPFSHCKVTKIKDDTFNYLIDC